LQGHVYCLPGVGVLAADVSVTYCLPGVGVLAADVSVTYSHRRSVTSSIKVQITMEFMEKYVIRVNLTLNKMAFNQTRF